MNTRNIFAASTIASALLLAACQPKADTAAAGAAKPIAMVNDTSISPTTFDFFTKAVAGKPAAGLTPEQRSQALDTLIRAEVVAQQAMKDGLDKQGDTPSQLEFARLQILEQASMGNYLKDRKATDAELKAEYDTQVAAMPKLQYKARHILVKTQEEAVKIIEQLKKGAKFETLAQAESIDNSKTNGGDLGWFSANNMVKPFSDAVAALKKGEYTQAPVQSEFGWHVIRLDDTRTTAPPAFDAVKDRIAQIVEAKKFNAYGDGLLQAAKVTRNP
jgi:peptidyl-prolyl cis-trans isomerase C